MVRRLKMLHGASLAQQLQSILDAKDAVLEGGLGEYAVDGSVPKSVARPANLEELSPILALANREGLAVIPRGSGTKMSVGGIPKGVDLVIEMKRLNRLLEHEPAELTFTAEAGAKLSEVQRSLAKEGQFLPLDPPFSDEATLGGIVATNSSGPRRLSYGTVRDLLLGIKVVHSDGRVSKAGGKVVKNVAGYDLKKLYVGSLGTLALIAQLTFRAYPIPEREATVLASFFSMPEACRASAALLNSSLLPSSVEVIDWRAANLMAEKASSPMAEEGPALAVRFEGVDADVERQASEAAEACRGLGARGCNLLEAGEQARLWASLKDLQKLCEASSSMVVVLKAGFLISMAQDAFGAVERVAEKYKLDIASFSHLGSGILYAYCLLDGSSEGKLGRFVPMVGELREFFSHSEGYLVLEAAPRAVKEEIDVWGPRRKDFAIMKAIKEKFDPKGILNPGRFVGGI